jgi:large subunit ribosomal protein L6
MSRIAKNPVAIPSGVTVTLSGQQLTIKGSKGSLQHHINEMVEVLQDGNVLKFAARNTSMAADALAGTARALVNNIVHGVTQGFERKLELVGVGYRAQAQGKKLNLALGFSHPVVFDVPEGIVIETPSQTEVIIKGMDKRLVGQVAANIRAYRSPECYKGKGVRYAGEHIKLKETKKK